MTQSTADSHNAPSTDEALDPQIAELSHSLGVTPEDLKLAVAEVGHDREKLINYFSQRQGAGYDR
jgi:hypothetical protein